MKSSTRLVSLFVAGTSLALGSLLAAEKQESPYLIHLTSIVDSEHRLLCGDGDTEARVRSALGSPDSVIGGTVWVYQRFARSEVRYATPGHRCDTILISFHPAPAAGARRVGEIARVNAADVATVAAAMIRDPKYVPNRVAAIRQFSPAPAFPDHLPFLIHITAVRNNDDSVLFRDGDAEEKARQAVGEPTEILPGEVWAYRRYERHQLKDVEQVADRHGCETTLVTFSPGAPGSGRTVTAIVMVNPSSLAAIAAELKHDPDYLVKRVQAWHDNSL